MASPVTICNLALAHIGAAQQVSAIDPPDGSALAGFCARFYPVSRREMLEHPWRFARRRTQLALLAGDPPVEWLYAYQLPADCIAPKRVVATTDDLFLLADFYWRGGLYYTPPPGVAGQGAAFEVEGQTLYTNQPDAVLLHTVDVIDTSVYTPAFVAALALHLGGYLAGVVLKGREGAALRQRLQEDARTKADMAFARDSNAGQDAEDYFSPALRARL